MRERIVRSLLLLVVLPAVLGAQASNAWSDSAARLQVAIHALRDSVSSGDSATSEVARDGNLVIAASASNRAIAAEALQRLVQVRDRWFGDAPAGDGGAHIVIDVLDESSGRGPRLPASASTVVLAVLPDTGLPTRPRSRATRDEVTAHLIDKYGATMFATTPAATWLNGALDLAEPEQHRREIAMYAFVTAEGADPRDCVAGVIAACKSALGLAPAVDVGNFADAVRGDLLLDALDVGGPGAWQRFREAGDSIGRALAAASRLPLDSLLTRWRIDVLDRHPVDETMSASMALLAVGWILVIGAAAVGVTRWV